jgi:pimeloyl-ACP methyl ester carboxylesterase
MFYSRPFVGSSAVADFTRAIRACRDRLTTAGIDLAAYNSAESAADLEALRRALGYRQWNLFALSADGVLGLTYMRLFPGGIRSAVVDSGQSPQHLWDLDFYRGLNELLVPLQATFALFTIRRSRSSWAFRFRQMM